MQPLPSTPFASGWWSFDLGSYRPCDSTYCRFPYESLPPLPEPDPTLSWLALPSGVVRLDKSRRDPAHERELLQVLAASAAQLGLSLPEPFVRLMGSPELQRRILSCTACWFGLAEEIVPCPGSPGAYLLCFLQDQQDSVIWYLYLTPAGEHCVVAIPGYADPFGEMEETEGIEVEGIEKDDEEDLDDEADMDIEASIREIRVCAPSFTAFIYRFWLENMIWYRLHGYNKTPFTDAERRYVEYYERQHTADS